MSGDSRILVPIISGVLWNVLMRIGCMDRLLHVISCKYWRPNNSSKLLRESGRRCVGGQWWAGTAVLKRRLKNGGFPSADGITGLMTTFVIMMSLSPTIWGKFSKIYVKKRSVFWPNQFEDHSNLFQKVSGETNNTLRRLLHGLSTVRSCWRFAVNTTLYWNCTFHRITWVATRADGPSGRSCRGFWDQNFGTLFVTYFGHARHDGT